MKIKALELKIVIECDCGATVALSLDPSECPVCKRVYIPVVYVGGGAGEKPNTDKQNGGRND